MDYKGITHDHFNSDIDDRKNMATIAILRRHPMYDCLVLVKRYRHCIGGFSLELPSSNHEKASQDCRTKLEFMFLDGDDPMMNHNLNVTSDGSPISTDGEEVVHVPVNGLMTRLEKYTSMGISVDSRVYAFAWGLKTAEGIIALDSIRPPEETPI